MPQRLAAGGCVRKLGVFYHRLDFLLHVQMVWSLLMGGCVADLFGDRAASYNQEVSINKDRTILTNIVRASLGRPLQFTEITTVSGTASQSLSLAGLIPFAVHRPLTVGQQSTFSPSMTLSGGPTFSIANLSSKEFYSGILTPLSTPILAYYLGEGRYPLHVLLPLVISEITYGPKSDQHRIANTISNLAEFNDALNGLRAIGLMVEPVNEAISEGPALTEEEAKNPKLLASLASGSAAGNTTLDLKRYNVLDPTKADNKDPNFSKSEYDKLKDKGGTYFRLEKKGGQKYRICFDRTTVENSLAHLNLHLPAMIPTSTLPGTSVRIQEKNLCGAKLHDEHDTSVKEVADNVNFTIRSVEGIISFLGEVVQSNRPLQAYTTPRGGPKIDIFTASELPPEGPSISASVDGQTYYVKVDATGKDMSSRVLQLLSELIALNNSAKDLPAPNVITVISP
jgi:hypothetical protein